MNRNPLIHFTSHLCIFADTCLPFSLCDSRPPPLFPSGLQMARGTAFPLSPTSSEKLPPPLPIAQGPELLMLLWSTHLFGDCLPTLLIHLLWISLASHFNCKLQRGETVSPTFGLFSYFLAGQLSLNI